MPTLRDYDANGILKPTTESNEPSTSFDSFMQELDQEYDKRKQAKAKPIQKKPSDTRKTTTAPPPPPPTPLTLDGPIQYRDQRKKKQKSPVKKTKSKPEVQPKKKPVVILSSSSEDDEQGETDPSKMIYDEDEAW